MVISAFYKLMFENKNYKEITNSLRELSVEGMDNYKSKEYITELIGNLLEIHEKIASVDVIKYIFECCIYEINNLNND